MVAAESVMGPSCPFALLVGHPSTACCDDGAFFPYAFPSIFFLFFVISLAFIRRKARTPTRSGAPGLATLATRAGGVSVALGTCGLAWGGVTQRTARRESLELTSGLAARSQPAWR